MCFIIMHTFFSLFLPPTVGECGQPGSYLSIQKMTEMKDKVAAFVGPDESCASEALVAAAWNKALISYVSSNTK